jgi:hypothetical protein
MRRLCLVVISSVLFLTTGCLGSSAMSPTTSPKPRTDVVVRLVAAFEPGHAPSTLHITCPGVAKWGTICAQMTSRWGVLVGRYINPACIGGAPHAEMTVSGVVAGHPVRLRQSGMCGPTGIYGWYRLLSEDHLLPDWVAS